MQTPNSGETLGPKLLKQTECAAVLLGSQILLLHSFSKLWRLTSLSDPKAIDLEDSQKAFNEGKTKPHIGSHKVQKGN